MRSLRLAGLVLIVCLGCTAEPPTTDAGIDSAAGADTGRPDAENRLDGALFDAPSGDDDAGPADAAAGDAQRGEDAAVADADGDGFAVEVDCDDANRDVWPGAPELCNTVDDDCDARIDEEAVDTHVFFQDLDGDGHGTTGDTRTACAAPSGFSALDDDCDDADAARHPGATESDCSDPVDYNCDGSVAYADADGDGVAACRDCADADSARHPGALELCNGIDDDCDPTTADDLDDPAPGSACDGDDADLCVEGHVSCSAGRLVCSDTTASTYDVCNGLDDDCSPGTADGSAEVSNGAPCDGGDVDLCAEGTLQCEVGSMRCSDATTDSIERCNGIDDDCDPRTADGEGEASIGAPCDGPDADACADGTWVCTTGSLSCNDTGGMTPDLCDGLDNDCNAGTPDGSGDSRVGTSCDGADSDLCAEGVYSCTTGALTCSDLSPDTRDLCNGIDDDCNPTSADGSSDPMMGVACDGADSDACADGARICTMGALACDDPAGTALDVCDGLDNDCNPGTPDGANDPLSGTACDGADADSCTEGMRVCTAGHLVCTDTTGDNRELCNGIDDDCSLATPDGSQDPAVGMACDSSDSDLCSDDTRQCRSGALVCTDLGSARLDRCNGLDDDCNPATPDGSGQSYSSCDGSDADVCADGVEACSGGMVVCSDDLTARVEACNGRDDDCDGVIDDGCPVSITVGTPTTTQYYGGPGRPGWPTRTLCPEGHVATGAYVESMDVVSYMVMDCAPLRLVEDRSGATYRYFVRADASTPGPVWVGADVVGPFDFGHPACPFGKFITNMYGRQGTNIDRIGFFCGDYELRVTPSGWAPFASAPLPPFDAGPFGGIGGAPFSATPLPARAFTRWRGREGFGVLVDPVVGAIELGESTIAVVVR